MTVREQVTLATLTTLRAGGAARVVAECTNEDEVREALQLSKERSMPWYPLGQGSNVLASDAGYEGVIIRPAIEDLAFEERAEDTLVTVGAGIAWDALVRTAASRGLWGIENLAGIPGSVGAAPVQNIGAYGAELSDTLEFVDALDADRGSVFRFTKKECELAYRDSRFKRERGLIIVRAGFRLSVSGEARTAYKDIASAQDAGADLSTPARIGETVRSIRARKFPDLKTHGTAGSFFKNPIVSRAEHARLLHAFPDMPSFESATGVKLPLAFVLDRLLNLRGFRMGNAWLYDAQPLVLVLDAGGTAQEVDALAAHVTSRVKELLGISIEREVRALPEK